MEKETSKFENPENPPEKGLITLQEASKITGLKIQTLRSRLKRGKLRGVKQTSQIGVKHRLKAENP